MALASALVQGSSLLVDPHSSCHTGPKEKVHYKIQILAGQLTRRAGHWSRLSQDTVVIIEFGLCLKRQDCLPVSLLVAARQKEAANSPVNNRASRLGDRAIMSEGKASTSYALPANRPSVSATGACTDDGILALLQKRLLLLRHDHLMPSCAEYEIEQEATVCRRLEAVQSRW